MTCGACGDPAICRDHGCQQEAYEYHLEQRRQAEQWTEADECEGRGHAYYGDDPSAPEGMAGRCYCGARRYLTGGPVTIRGGVPPIGVTFSEHVVREAMKAQLRAVMLAGPGEMFR